MLTKKEQEAFNEIFPAAGAASIRGDKTVEVMAGPLLAVCQLLERLIHPGHLSKPPDGPEMAMSAAIKEIDSLREWYLGLKNVIINQLCNSANELWLHRQALVDAEARLREEKATGKS